MIGWSCKWLVFGVSTAMIYGLFKAYLRKIYLRLFRGWLLITFAQEFIPLCWSLSPFLAFYGGIASS